jgi:hypothetical protein
MSISLSRQTSACPADRILGRPKNFNAPFGDARWKISGEAIKSGEMYFATYQAIARDEARPGLYRDSRGTSLT